MSSWALLVAAGSGRRMGLERNKVLEPLRGLSVLERSVRAFEGVTDGVCVVIRPQDEAEIRAMNLGARLAYGGETRQASVLSGLRALPPEADLALVHDAARPLVTRAVIERCLQSARRFGSGVAAIPLKDTVKRVKEDGWVAETPDRETLRAVQTPQAFRVQALRQAIETLTLRHEIATDDAGAVEAAGGTVRLVEGDVENIKLTTPEDFLLARQILDRRESKAMLRIGHGYDAHRLVPERKLILCGVEIPFEKGLLGHSDADVALHALMDALLGAAALGDIGEHFPDTDPRYRGISSVTLLEAVAALLQKREIAMENVDLTLLAQRPKLKPYIPQMRENIARALSLDAERVSVKATTTEGMGFEGEGLGISAHAVALVRAERS